METGIRSGPDGLLGSYKDLSCMCSVRSKLKFSSFNVCVKNRTQVLTSVFPCRSCEILRLATPKVLHSSTLQVLKHLMLLWKLWMDNTCVIDQSHYPMHSKKNLKGKDMVLQQVRCACTKFHLALWTSSSQFSASLRHLCCCSLLVMIWSANDLPGAH